MLGCGAVNDVTIETTFHTAPQGSPAVVVTLPPFRIGIGGLLTCSEGIGLPRNDSTGAFKVLSEEIPLEHLEDVAFPFEEAYRDTNLWYRAKDLEGGRRYVVVF